MEEVKDKVQQEAEETIEEVKETEERMTRKDKIFLSLTAIASATFGFAVGWTARGAKEKSGDENENAE